MRIVLQIVLAVAIVFLGYMVFQSINVPMQFEKIKNKRDREVIAKLKDIREAQRAYVLSHGKYTGSFDSLENFIRTGNIPLIKRTGVLTDEMLADGINEEKAIKKGLIQIDTIKVPVMDSLFGKRPNFKVENMKYLPIPDKKETFDMAAKELPTESGLLVPVYEVKVHYDKLFQDLREGEYNEEYRADTMELVRLNKYIGLKIGSLEEANDGAGNWE
ncbi:hypothetical protein C7377_1783 [Balneicella halophila]|uniref:Uncharacterized protein n=1 Tax=Balneicella halophila TaxID=1537566 RepID=A0A7L4UNA0_BALHA|nr:hypothetical protein [Balneicella halophila]PVX49367.1 hypothetical protein C7377_1783 [Balneicella halophila]